MPTQNPNFIAGETLYPNRFVVRDATDDNTVNMATAGLLAIGITHEGSKYAPIPEVATVTLAEAGDGVRVHGDGEEAYLDIAGTVTPDDYLKPDADGKGVVASAANPFSAIALQNGSSGEQIRVLVERGVTPS